MFQLHVNAQAPKESPLNPSNPFHAKFNILTFLLGLGNIALTTGDAVVTGGGSIFINPEFDLALVNAIIQDVRAAQGNAPK